MSLLRFLKPNRACDSCQRISDKKRLYLFDSTFRGTRKQGEKLSLCRQCFLEKIKLAFNSYFQQAVLVAPVTQGYNAYHFFNFQEMKRFNFKGNYVASIQQILPTNDSSCRRCRATAHFTWVDSSLYRDNPYLGEPDGIPFMSKTFLCGNCLFKEFEKQIINHDLYFDEFHPPVDKNGFATSGEY
jgi:hypothetical protein